MTRNCDGCGRFLPLFLEHGSSHTFVPDTYFTYEECLIHCPRCTKKHGAPASEQYPSVVSHVVDRSNTCSSS